MAEGSIEMSSDHNAGGGLRDFGRAAWQKIEPFVSIIVVIAIWHIVTQMGLILPFLLPKPLDVLMQVAADVTEGRYFQNLALTMYRTIAGFAVAAVVGVGLGILLAHSRRLAWFFDPVMSAMLPVPKFAFLPIFMIWFGIENGSKIMLAAFTVVFQVVVAVWQAASSIERKIVWSARSLGASERRMLWEIVLPAALPAIITSLQVAMPICFVVVIAAEFITSGGGLGDQMMVASRYSNSVATFAALVEIAITGFLLLKAMEKLRRLLLPWHQEAEIVTN